jgi:hypothetical protein
MAAMMFFHLLLFRFDGLLFCVVKAGESNSCHAGDEDENYDEPFHSRKFYTEKLLIPAIFAKNICINEMMV